MSHFKIGQKVKLIAKNDDGLSAEVGPIGRIEELTTDPEYPIDVFWFQTEGSEAVHPSEIITFEEENK